MEKIDRASLIEKYAQMSFPEFWNFFYWLPRPKAWQMWLDITS